ncbi:MAG TPA: pitrilysin family protein [Bryobacterales bacterium]|nr:pitrilysin family protein [Bryobacterales bacterium]
MPTLVESETRNIEKAELPNGVSVISEVMPHVRSVSTGVWIKTGSRQERPEQNGISHFIEHMVFKGTATRSAEDIARSIDSVGGHLDAFTAKELISFSTKVLDEHLPLAFDVVSDLVLHPIFQPEDIRKEQGVVLEELKMDEDNPDFLVHEIFCGNFWKEHSLGKPIIGSKKTIASFERETLFDYYNSVYVPSNILVTAAGRLGHDRLMRLAEQAFGELAARPAPPQDPAPSTHAIISLRDKPSLEQVHLCLGVPSYPLADERRYASYVLNTLLGGGMSSRLFQNIREKQGLVYSVYSDLNPYRDTGCLSIYAGTSIENAERVVELILKELREIKDGQITPEELRRAKDHLKGSLMLSLESTSSRMANLARQEIYFGHFFSLDELIEAIEQVTVAEVEQIASDSFNQKQIALTVLGNLNGFKIGREKLVC